MIRAEHIVKSFDGRVVLDDISVEFETGKTNLIIGRSGSGKTVLLKTLVGLHEPDSGDGKVILLHDDRPGADRLLRLVLDDLKRRGYGTATVCELFKIEKP